MVDARRNLDRIVRGSGDVDHADLAAAKVLILTGRNIGLPILHGLNEVLDRLILKSHGLAQRLIGITAQCVAAVDELVSQGNLVNQGLVKDDIGIGAGLLEFGLGYNVTARHVIHKAFALAVYDDCTVAAQRLGNEQTVGLDDGRVKLDLLHVDSGGANRFSHCNAIAGRTGMVGGNCIGEGRIIARHQLKVGTEAAGRKDDRLRVYGIDMCLVLSNDTDSLSVIHEDLGGTGVEHNFNAKLFRLGRELVHEVLANGAAVLRLVQILVLGAAGGCNFGQRRTDGLEPFDSFRASFAEGAHQLGICKIMAETEGIRNIIVDSAVVEAECCLHLCPGSVHAALGAQAVAADVGHLLEHKHFRAGLGGTYGRSQTCTACTDNDDIAVEGHGCLLAFFLRGELDNSKVCGIDAGIG